ncbi:MAG: aromatic ring-hydroxylating dioxygenase subunit alpha [Alphaproteobacteria bacterium]
MEQVPNEPLSVSNAWYVVAHASDLKPGTVLGRRLLGQEFALFRLEDGALGAFEDRCPHRLLPLSMGAVVGNVLQCSYHGACFEAQGKCVSVPGQTRVPAKARARTYPVQERYGFIWLWPGDPALSHDERSIPDVFQYGVEPYDARNGQILSFGANYELIVDNLLDAGHAEFVHKTSFGSEGLQVTRKHEENAAVAQTEHDFHADVADDGITYKVLLNKTRPGPCFIKAYAMKQGLEYYDGLLDWHMDVSWVPPGCFVFSSVTKAPGAPYEEGIGLINIHALSPETGDTTNYFFRNAYRFIQKNDDLMHFWHETALRAFKEDKIVIEAQKRSMKGRALFDYDLCNFDSDSLSNAGRKILQNAAAGNRTALSAAKSA